MRFVGEQTGLSAMVSKSSVLRKHDTLGLGSEILVDTYSKKGFTISGVSLIGPVLLLPKAGFYFGPSGMSELTPESLALLQLHEKGLQLLDAKHRIVHHLAGGDRLGRRGRRGGRREFVCDGARAWRVASVAAAERGRVEPVARWAGPAVHVVGS